MRLDVSPVNNRIKFQLSFFEVIENVTESLGNVCASPKETVASRDSSGAVQGLSVPLKVVQIVHYSGDITAFHPKLSL